HPVEVGVLELAHGPLGVLPVLDRFGRDELELAGHAQVRGQFGGVPLLPLGDPGDHVVIKILHDAEDPDARAVARLACGHDLPPERWPSGRQRWPYSVVYRRCRASTWSAGSGCGSPSTRARWTVRAASSHMTAALTAARAVGPTVKTPWLRMSTAGERCPVRGATTPLPISSPPMSANGPSGISPPNSSAMAGDTQGDAPPRAPPPGGD